MRKPLLKLREKFSAQCDDKKTNKMKLWHKIAETLKANGHNVGEGEAERCRQKFSNLTKPYLKYIKPELKKLTYHHFLMRFTKYQVE